MSFNFSLRLEPFPETKPYAWCGSMTRNPRSTVDQLTQYCGPACRGCRPDRCTLLLLLLYY
eukprot:1587191-Amphidinium_carterae.1